MRIFLVFIASVLSLSAKKEIDLVAYGQEVFHTVGCAECHSEIKNDPSVKTGPGLYALFQKDARQVEVLAGGEQHRETIKADFKYFQQSVRNPHADLAIAEQGSKKGEAYLPVMPPYPKDFLSDFKVKAIYQYLLTLNEEDQRGPAKVMVEDKSGSKLTNVLDDPNEILVTDRTRIYRTRIKGQSARAVYVGTPEGFNYAFDPASLSIERLWWGGFINIAGSLDGRGQKPSRLGHNALEIKIKAPLLAPIDPQTGKPVDLSFKSPRMGDFKTIAKTLNNEEDFARQLAEAGGSFLGYEQAETPTFFFQVGKNTFQLQFMVNESGEAKLTLEGKLTTPQTFQLAPLIKGKAENWTVTSLPAELIFQVPVKPAWRPTNAPQAPAEQTVRMTPAKSVNLPPGYLAEQIAAPTDINGRDQMFEPLGMVNSRDGSLIIATRTAGIWKLHNSSGSKSRKGFKTASVYSKKETAPSSSPKSPNSPACATSMATVGMTATKPSAKPFSPVPTTTNTSTAPPKAPTATITSVSTSPTTTTKTPSTRPAVSSWAPRVAIVAGHFKSLPTAPPPPSPTDSAAPPASPPVPTANSTTPRTRASTSAPPNSFC